MKKHIAFLIFSAALFVFACKASAQDDTNTKTLSRNESYVDYSYFSYSLTSADVLIGTRDSVIFEVSFNKHQPVDWNWYIEIDTTGASNDSVNFNILSEFKIFDSEDWVTRSTTVWDGDANGDLDSLISDTSFIAKDTLLTNTDNFARKARLYILPSSGAGLGSVGDSARILNVELKAYIRD